MNRDQFLVPEVPPMSCHPCRPLGISGLKKVADPAKKGKTANESTWAVQSALDDTPVWVGMCARVCVCVPLCVSRADKSFPDMCLLEVNIPRSKRCHSRGCQGEWGAPGSALRFPSAVLSTYPTTPPVSLPCLSASQAVIIRLRQ